jgi:hypothetical protein
MIWKASKKKKNETEIQNKMEGHSSRIEQKTKSQNLMKWQLKEKLKNYYLNNSRPVKRKCRTH